MTEQQLHRQVADFLDVALKPPAWWTTFPAGGGARSWQNLQGLKCGVWDILIIAPGLQGFPRVVWIELKVGRGRLSKDQFETGANLRRVYCLTCVCWSLEEVFDFLKGLDLLKENVTLA